MAGGGSEKPTSSAGGGEATFRFPLKSVLVLVAPDVVAAAAAAGQASPPPPHSVLLPSLPTQPVPSSREINGATVWPPSQAAPAFVLGDKTEEGADFGEEEEDDDEDEEEPDEDEEEEDEESFSLTTFPTSSLAAAAASPSSSAARLGAGRGIAWGERVSGEVPTCAPTMELAMS